MSEASSTILICAIYGCGATSETWVRTAHIIFKQCRPTPDGVERHLQTLHIAAGSLTFGGE